jgi:hypothetical protein
VYDAEEVKFRRYIGTLESSGLEMENGDISLHSYLASNMNAPETDQLGDWHVKAIEHKVRITLHFLKDRFIKHRRLRRAESLLEFVDDDETEEEDGEFDIEVDDFEDEDDEEMDEDDDDDVGVIFHEQNGELYIEVYESESEDGDDGHETGMDEPVDYDMLHGPEQVD